ncbi:Uncharacterised protein [Vibrio cholerae]|nr:Uncharacterised protein [Vibrio cholerae]CSB79734.1 Uncharacterised protein [Vibrio cholerae]
MQYADTVDKPIDLAKLLTQSLYLRFLGGIECVPSQPRVLPRRRSTMVSRMHVGLTKTVQRFLHHRQTNTAAATDDHDIHDELSLF